VAVGLSVAGGCGRHALSTAARELWVGGGGGRRARGGAVVVGRDAHLAGVAQLETGAVRTTALHAAAAAAAQRRADVRTPAIVVLARVATCSTSRTSNKLLAAHVYAAYELNSTTRTRARARHGHGLFCGETDPHGPNGVSPQKSPCPCRARVVEFSYMLLCIAACNTNRVAARYCPQRVAR